MKTRLRPSKQLRELVRLSGGVHKTSLTWGIPYRSLRRFLSHNLGISGDTAAAIMKATGLSFSSLFVIK